MAVAVLLVRVHTVKHMRHFETPLSQIGSTGGSDSVTTMLATSQQRASAWNRIRREISANGTLLLMALPGMLILFTFSYLPMPGIVLAFKDFKAAQGIWGSEWVGLANFEYLFSTGTAWRIIRNTVFINGLFIVATLVASLAIAVLLHEIHDHFASRIYQSVLFFPYFVSFVIVGYFTFIFLSSDGGVVNGLLQSLGLQPVAWFNEPQHWPAILTKPLQPKTLLTTGIGRTGTAVCSTSKYPDLAVKYIEEVNQNPELYNLLNFGIEGKHWVWKDKANKVIGLPEGQTMETVGWLPNTYWQFGDRRPLYLTDPTDIGVFDRIDKALAEADISPVMGFTFDRKPVENEIAQVNTIAKEYERLNRGMVDDIDATLTEYKAKLKEAGIDKIIAEMQRQIDEWAKTLPSN